MKEIFILLFVGLFSYLLGSFPTAVLIGKVFFKKDVREHGSKNSGGTNAGRVLGKKVGLIVIIIDIIKTILPIYLSYFSIKYFFINETIFLDYVIFISSITCLIGHCFPIFAQFKGGKAVSSYAAIIFATNWLLSIIGLTIFFLVLKIKKYVSLSSICCGLILPLITLMFAIFKLDFTMNISTCNYLYVILILLSGFVLVVRHGSNIKRLMKHEEGKISWMK